MCAQGGMWHVCNVHLPPSCPSGEGMCGVGVGRYGGCTCMWVAGKAVGLCGWGQEAGP